MKLTGLEIVVNGKAKFVGKVGVCPRNAPSNLRGRVICYREVKWKDVFSYTTNTVGMDAAAWDRARELGAVAMVVYSADESKMITVKAEDIDHAFRLDLGEAPQYRIPLAKCHEAFFAGPIPMGWTKNVERIEAVVSPITEEPEAPILQPSLF